MTEWRKVPGLPVEASDLGEIRDLGAVHPRKTRKPNSGYLRVRVQGKTIKVHVLVAAAFHGPRPDGLETRHRNGDSLDNRPENLCYGTHAENMTDLSEHFIHPTECANGHSMTEENTYRWGTWLKCRQCIRIADARYKERKRAS